MMNFDVIHGSILDVDAEVIVNAANSYGMMGGGVAGVIKRAAGSVVEDEARKQAPIPVGQAVLTSGGNTKFKGIIHAPTMTEPSMLIPAHHASLATSAALRMADVRGFASVAIPGMGTGVGGVSAEEAARHMIDAIKQFAPRSLRVVLLVDVDPNMVQAWRKQLIAYGL
ncbi:MAG: macro domain-containing protein [Nitrospiraceae bacterium]|nr:macro domain-containing protein [Nitrospiraceae bacterium]